MPITKTAAQVLDILTAGLSEAGDIRRVGPESGAFMQVIVECQGEEHFSVSHYYESNGDLVPDPDMTFYRYPSGAWLPVSITQHNRYQLVAEFNNDDSAPSKINAAGAVRLGEFAAFWMRNIAQQQDLTAISAAAS